MHKSMTSGLPRRRPPGERWSSWYSLTLPARASQGWRLKVVSHPPQVCCLFGAVSSYNMSGFALVESHNVTSSPGVHVVTCMPSACTFGTRHGTPSSATVFRYAISDINGIKVTATIECKLQSISAQTCPHTLESVLFDGRRLHWYMTNLLSAWSM